MPLFILFVKTVWCGGIMCLDMWHFCLPARHLSSVKAKRNTPLPPLSFLTHSFKSQSPLTYDFHTGGSILRPQSVVRLLLLSYCLSVALGQPLLLSVVWVCTVKLQHCAWLLALYAVFVGCAVCAFAENIIRHVIFVHNFVIQHTVHRYMFFLS